MAREYARVKVKIWADDDFRSLPVHAQWAYFMLITSPKMTLCGVTDWRPKRLASFAGDTTQNDVEAGVQVLAESGYVVVDEDMEEVLVRSFIRHDGVYKTPNIASAMVKDYAGVASKVLRGVIIHELLRLRDEEPTIKAWAVASEILTEQSVDPSTITPFKASPNPSLKGCEQNPSAKASAKASGTGSHIPHPSTPYLQPATHSPGTRASTGDSPEFVEFWKTYPRRADKGHARTAWVKAVRVADPEQIIAGAARFRDDPNREDRYTPLAATWLNGHRWDDDPLPAKSVPGNARDAALEAEWNRVHDVPDEPELLEIGGGPWTPEER